MDFPRNSKSIYWRKNRKNHNILWFFGVRDWSRTNDVSLRSPSQMPKLYAKCPFLFIFVRFMQYFSSILHNILLFKWWFLCLFVGSKTETLPKYYQFSQKIGYLRHIETPVFTRENRFFPFLIAKNIVDFFGVVLPLFNTV